MLASSTCEILRSAKGDAVLAIVIGVQGPSYRPLGAIMSFLPDGERIGSLSSGCVESDLFLHAGAALADGCPKVVRYGCGSPFIDIRLPCGGGLEILLLPRPDQGAIAKAVRELEDRRATTLSVEIDSGMLSTSNVGRTCPDHDMFHMHFLPEPRFLVFGKGPEVATFARLVNSSGYPNVMLSPDDETLNIGRQAGCRVRRISPGAVPPDLKVDARTAIVLFFHDHEWELPILAEAVRTPAFYIGAQGSRLTRENRDRSLLSMGVSRTDVNRLHGPVGLVRSARDPRTLAVSVLAEVLGIAAEPERNRNGKAAVRAMRDLRDQ